jgi:creatinine amidohydrolase
VPGEEAVDGMRLESMNWMQVAEAVRHDDRLMLVTGSCEQHGYLSVLTDVAIPVALADAASAATGVLVAPPLAFGVSPAFAAYPGTISLRVSTFLAVIEDLVRGVHHQGFHRLLFVNGHGGNEPARALLSELLNELPDLQVAWHSWWSSPAVTRVASDAGLASFHGGWIEAFEWCRVGELPDGEKPPASSARILSAEDARALYGDGVFGGPYRADDTLMQRVFDAAVADIVERLRFDP